MKKVLGRGFILGGTVLMMSGYYLTVNSAMNYKTTAVAHADDRFTPDGEESNTAFQGGLATMPSGQVAPDTTNVILHKTMFDQKDEDYFATHKIKNDGTNKEDQFGDKLFHYNRNTMGKIGFNLL